MVTVPPVRLHEIPLRRARRARDFVITPFGWLAPFCLYFLKNNHSYRTIDNVERHVVANSWRRLAAITLSGGEARHKILAPNVGWLGAQQGTLGC